MSFHKHRFLRADPKTRALTKKNQLKEELRKVSEKLFGLDFEVFESVKFYKIPDDISEYLFKIRLVPGSSWYKIFNEIANEVANEKYLNAWDDAFDSVYLTYIQNNDTLITVYDINQIKLEFDEGMPCGGAEDTDGYID